ncbi:glycosyltransferase [Dermacoccus nishinomiyaensis]|uniref:glycosyltransferase n=1 Tax=Dermacoccus nishinomiyaensis TaxID=1274 RepID=UPI0033B5D2FA
MIRVASVPADHPYVAHLSPSGETPGDGCDEVIRLPDPPVIADDGSTRWWPPRILDPAWLREHAGEFDVLHVHFGFESFSPEHLREVVDVAHELGKGVVVTVHDLRNPHIKDPAAQLSRLDALVPAADAVITLTQGAADAIQARWGRDAVVVRHPHIVPLDVMAALLLDDTSSRTNRADARSSYDSTAAPARNDRRRIGLHLKSLRTNVDAAGALDALALVADERPDVEIVVTMHRAVADPTDRGHDACVVERAEALAARGAITLVLHEPMDDATLFAFVDGLDVSVMANVWGTHSGWIEMCHDLGVRVVAPNIGFYGEQHTPVLYDLAGRGDEAEDGAAASEDATVDARRLADTILVAVDQGRAAPADVAARRDERDAGARVHSEIYRASIPTR